MISNNSFALASADEAPLGNRARGQGMDLSSGAVGRPVTSRRSPQSHRHLIAKLDALSPAPVVS